MSLDRLLHTARTLLPPSKNSHVVAQPLPGLIVLSHTRPTVVEATLYEPLFCLILQGQKETALGDVRVQLRPGLGLLVSHDLPVLSQVTEASVERPYVALVLRLDTQLLRGLYEEVADDLSEAPGGSFQAQGVEPELVDALGRYLGLATRPLDAKVLGPAVHRELHFRLLMGPSGAMLRSLLRHDSAASQIARALAQLRREFRAPLAVADLARTAGMSPSAFHRHFKTITATTPLQYQKDLRLLEARRLLCERGSDVAEAAFAVGYESPTQFSREYKRKFGAAPSRARQRVA